MSVYEDVLTRAYELYKHDWCDLRGYDYSLVEQAFEHGQQHNGEMFCCIDEFEDNEFRDEEYMEELFGSEWETVKRMLHGEESIQNTTDGGKNMNEWDRLHRQAELYKSMYPKGTRIMLLSMGNDPHPVEDNTRGTVIAVDDIGTIHCAFDNGRMLGICPGEDSFRKLTDEELAEEQSADMTEDESGPVMRM